MQKREQTLQEMEELKFKMEAIDRTVASIKRYKNPASGTITLEYIPDRTIYSMTVDKNFL